MNKIKLVWFYSLYRNSFFELKCDFLYILKIIFTVFTLENILKILNNSVYFQNIVVCNEPLTDKNQSGKLQCNIGLKVKESKDENHKKN